MVHLVRRGDYCCSSSLPEESTISFFIDGAVEEEDRGERGRRRHDPKGEQDPPTGAENQLLWEDLPIAAERRGATKALSGEEGNKATG